MPVPITQEMLMEALVNTANAEEIKKKQIGFLCMYSGGAASTAMLHTLLTNEAYNQFNAYIHHIRFDHCEAETKVVRNIVKHYRDDKNIRVFDYKESTFSGSSSLVSGSAWAIPDMDVAAFVAAQACVEKPQIKYAALGVTKVIFKTKDEAVKLRYENAPKIFSASLYGFPSRIPKPTMIYPLQQLAQLELWESMPKNIQQMVLAVDL